MRFILWVALLGLLGAGCSRLQIHACVDDDGCIEDATCVEGYCVFDPAPWLNVSLSQGTARVGEEVTLIAEGGLLGGSPLAYEVEVAPAGAAEVRSHGPGAFSLRIAKPKVQVVAVVRARTDTGREAVSSVSIAPRNSPPTVTLRVASDEAQPRGVVVLMADVEDPDRDPLEIRWSLEHGDGELERFGDRATLTLGPDPEASYRVSVFVSDGQEEATATVTFQAENLPPRILGFDAPEVSHSCDPTLGCLALATVVAHVLDPGPLQYRWSAWDAGEGADGGVRVVERDERAFVYVEKEFGKRMAGPYGFEVVVTDEHGATTRATGSFTVGNRPPVVQVDGGQPLHHTYLRHDRFRWVREPGTFDFWSDPDGDPPVEVEWFSPAPAVRFSDPKAFDPSIEVIGNAQLLETGVPIEVRARGPNGGEAFHAGVLTLGNRPPVLHEVVVGPPVREMSESLRQTIQIAIEELDGDPMEVSVGFDPTDPVPDFNGLVMRETGPGTWEVTGPDSMYGITYRILIQARDILGAELSEVVPIFVFEQS